MSTNQMETILQAVDHASRASDRWAFFAALVILGIFAVLVMKRLVNQNATLIQTMNEDRKLYDSRVQEERKNSELALKTIIADQHAQVKLVTEAQVKNTIALDLNTAALNNVSGVVGIIKGRQ